MLRLIFLELLKISKRPLTWIILVLLVTSVAGTLLGANALLQEGNLFNPQGQAITVEEGITNFTFPGVWPSILVMTRQVGSWLLVVFTAIFIGMEEAWGTHRVILGTGLSRTRFLASKLGSLLVVVVSSVLASLVVGSIAAVFIQASVNVSVPPTTLGVATLLQLSAMILRVVAVLYLPVLLTFFATILTRSQVTGVALGLGYNLFEAIVKSVLSTLGATGEALRPLLIGYNVESIMFLNTFTGNPSPPPDYPSVLVATLALAIYALLFTFSSWYIFQRRDITSGANG